MATTHRSDLVDEIEKALRDEAYDGGFGYMGDEHFTAYVRGLAVTAAKVVEEAHTPTDDEREALLTEADALVASWDQKGSWSSDSPVGMVTRLAAALRRSEVPEPSVEERIEQAIAYIRASWVGLGEPTPNTPAGAIIEILEGELSFAEPQGEPSSEVPEPSAGCCDVPGGPERCGDCPLDRATPPGEPSDASVQAALDEWCGASHALDPFLRMRAALPAAGGAR